MSDVKEPHFFAEHEFAEEVVKRLHLNDVDPQTYVKSLVRRPAHFAVFRDPAAYLALFSQASLWRFEASTGYLACPEAPGAIRAAFPSAKVITLCRDPVERALSHYRLYRSIGRTRRSLKAELQAELSGKQHLAENYLLRPSRQAAGVERVEAAFGSQRHLPLTFEDVLHPAATLARVADFLGLAAEGFDLRVQARNPARKSRLPGLNAWLFHTGLRRQLRRALPGFAKKLLAPLFFAEGSFYSEEEVQLLRNLLAEET